MTPAEIAEALGVEAQLAGTLMQRLRPDAPGDWRALAAALSCRRDVVEGVRVLGVAGGQGAGKSTLAGLLAEALTLLGLRVVVLSLDDFYLTRQERAALAEDESPLLATRGVPGTHDVARLAASIEALFETGTVALPVFDKGIDDRAAEDRRVAGPCDLVVLEGWCVGARPQPQALLGKPVNELEAREDADGRWRRYVNACLAGSYAELWQRLDRLLYLAVPDLDAVRRWRGEQERERPPALRLDAQAVKGFVAYYERLTRWMLSTLPESADFVGFLDAAHRLERLRVRG